MLLAMNDSPPNQPEVMQPNRVFVLAQQDFLVEGMLEILSRSPTNQVIACVKRDSECLKKLTAQPVDVLLIQHQALNSDPAECFAIFREHLPELKVLVFGQGMSDSFLLRILRAGADGYINDQMSSDHLAKAIQYVRHGGLWAERRILERLAFRVAEIEGVIVEAIAAIRGVLTRRESQIYQLILEGLATKEIAGELCLSEPSVKLHLKNIFKKFDVTNRQQLILMTFLKVCPVSNVLNLFRIVVDKQRLENGQPPFIPDPLGAGI